MVVYAAELPEHEVAEMASTLRNWLSMPAMLAVTWRRCSRLRLLPLRARPSGLHFGLLRNRLPGTLFVYGFAFCLSSCAVESVPSSIQPPLAQPYLALRSATAAGIPEASLTGALYIQNGCVVFRLYGAQEASTPVFDNRSRLVLASQGFVVRRPQGDLVGGKTYNFGGGAANRQTPLVAPVPDHCPQTLVLLGSATLAKGM